MGRLNFDSEGNLVNIDGKDVSKEVNSREKRKYGNLIEEGGESGGGDNWANNKAGEGYNGGEENAIESNFNGIEQGSRNIETIERSGWENKNRPNRFKENYKFGAGKNIKGNISERKYYDEFDKTIDKYEGELRKSDSLSFLKENEEVKDINNMKKYWNFYSGNKELEPLKFSNNKTQEDIVREVVELINKGEKIIFLHGTCGSGKSAIALNIARALGKTSIVVPLKALQKQYEDDYTGEKYLVKPNGERLKIVSITGKDNHDSVINPGVSCSDPTLPENIKITEKNAFKIMDYYNKNENNEKRDDPELKEIKRMWIAPANPYWSPILPDDFNIKMNDAKKHEYEGVNSKKFIFYHRRRGCSYYDQYLGYIQADVLIYNSAKYKAELLLERRPDTKVDIIDEADEFLDSLFGQKDINLTKLYEGLENYSTDSRIAENTKEEIMRLIKIEIENIEGNEVNEDDAIKLKQTNIKKVIELLAMDSELVAEIGIDELNYVNKVVEIAKEFKGIIDETYLTYQKFKGSVIVKIVSPDLSSKVKEIVDKNNAIVFMSGTLHSEEVIKNILGIKKYSVVEAETLNHGNIEIIRTGREFNCQYSSFNENSGFSRRDYLVSTNLCMDKAKLPMLVHVNAFKDLPTNDELKTITGLKMMSTEELIRTQKEDKTGEEIVKFKKGNTPTLFTTKCSRGIDFPGDMCRSILFTKYPNPNIQDTFWKILKKTQPDYFWSFYKDKARREFLQRIYRALRSKDDHIYILSPDTRVLDAVREIQLANLKNNKGA